MVVCKIKLKRYKEDNILKSTEELKLFFEHWFQTKAQILWSAELFKPNSYIRDPEPYQSIPTKWKELVNEHIYTYLGILSWNLIG